MGENKTGPTTTPAADFVAQLEPQARRHDATMLMEVMARLSGLPPVMWGASIIGFGMYHYRYESGREGNMPRIAFAPRKAELVLYMGAANGNVAALLPGLGKYKTGKECVYLKRLADVDMAVLEQIIAQALANRPG
ncbi:MAG: DUF1801 domain-containing protein [Sphingomonas sp.]|jgi:hypothetical protein